MSELKLWAVVIGNKRKSLRYVTYDPFIPTNCDNLAVYETRTRAREARKKVLADCGHKSVHVIPFESVEP